MLSTTCSAKQKSLQMCAELRHCQRWVMNNRQLFVQKRDFCLPHLHSMPPLGGPRRNIAATFGVEKLEWCGYQKVKKFEDRFIRFDRIHERDRQTDKWTDGYRMTAQAAHMHSIERQKLVPGLYPTWKLHALLLRSVFSSVIAQRTKNRWFHRFKTPSRGNTCEFMHGLYIVKSRDPGLCFRRWRHDTGLPSFIFTQPASEQSDIQWSDTLRSFNVISIPIESAQCDFLLLANNPSRISHCFGDIATNIFGNLFLLRYTHHAVSLKAFARGVRSPVNHRIKFYLTVKIKPHDRSYYIH